MFKVNWKMNMEFSSEEYEDRDDMGMGFCTIRKGRLYFDRKYGYYERKYAICSTKSYATYRFNKSKMGDVLKYLCENSPENFESYLETVDGCELIECEYVS